MSNTLEVRGVSLRFGGVRALTEVSFGVKEGELFSIIGPNGAGKTSIVNCISGRYKPTEGAAVLSRQGHHRPQSERTRLARHRPHLPEPGAVPPHERARQHHGRAPSPPEEQLPHGIAVLADRRAARGARASPQGRGDHRLPRPAVGAQGDRRHPALRPAQARRAGARHGAGAAADPARRADGRHELRREGGHGPLHRRPQRGVRHDGGDDRARHGRGDGYLPPRHGAGFRPQDRRRRSGRPCWPIPHVKRAYLGEEDEVLVDPDDNPAAGECAA